MKKKHWLRSFVAAVTASALVWTCAPVGALAAGPGTDGSTATVARAATLLAEGTDWTLDTNGTLNIASDKGLSDWHNFIYSYRTDVKAVILQNGVTSISANAFTNCSNLTSVTIPDSVTSIGPAAFCLCSSLTNLTIPDGVTSIGNYAFESCRSLKSINIPDSVASIEWGAFKDCSSLASVIIPYSITTIDTRTFSGCNNLSSIIIPSSVTAILSEAFDGCDNLTVYCDANSYAESYCIENNIPYKPLSEYPGGGLLLVTNTLTLEKGTTGKLSVFGTGTKTWTSADPSIATVSADEGGSSATVTAVSEGETTVTVTCGTESATAKVIVTSSSTGDEEGEETSSFVLNPANLTLEEESQGVIIPETVPDTQTISWTSSDENVVSLKSDLTTGKESCVLKANSVGTATITATYGNDSATCSVTVVETFDRWGIANPKGSYPISVDEVANKYKEASGKELTPTERYRVQKEINRSNKENTDAALCHGLSLTTMLTHTGDLQQPWLWGSSDEFVPDSLLSATVLTPELKKQLAYYQLSQQFDVAKDAETAYTRAAKKDKMKVYNDLKNMLSSGNGFEKPVMIGFEYFDDWKKAAHAVLAYEFQTGSWNINIEIAPGETRSKHFDTRVRYYEPNSPIESYVPPKTQDDSRYYLYLNSETGDWAFDCGKYEASDNYNYLSTANSLYSAVKIDGALYEIANGFYSSNITIVSNDPNDFIPLENHVSEDIVNILTISNVSSLYNSSEASPFSVKSDTEEWDWTNIAKEENGIVTLVNSRDAVNSEEEGPPINIVFPTPSQNYTVQLNDNSIHEFTMDYTNMLLSADVDQTYNGEITFSQDGSVALSGNEGHYELSSTLNDAPMDLFTVTASGEKATEVKLVPTEDGYLVDGNDLSDLTISGNDADQTKTLPLNTDKKSVKVTEDSENELVVSIDQDEDGTYETPIATTESVNSISLNKTSLSMRVGDTASLTATCDPENATVQWTSSNLSVATVENGTVKALKPGTATITAKAGDKSATCTVTVTGSGGTPSTPSQPSKPSNPGTPSTPSTPSKPAAPETEMTTKVTLQNGSTVTIASPDDVIEIPQSSCFQVVFTNENDLDGFTLTAGNGKAIATDTVAAWNPETKTGTYTLYGLGAPGTAHDTTGIYVNGVKLFTMRVVPRPLTSDTTVDFAMQVGGTYQFWVKPDDPSASYTFNTANGDMLQTAIVKDAYPDEQGRYLCRLTVTGRGDTVGVYCNIDGNTYKLFTVNCQ